MRRPGDIDRSDAVCCRTLFAARHDRHPDRRLKVGYVSPDFRNHCQSLFTVPLLSHHDHQRFQIYCYAQLPHPDAISKRLATYADVWRPTYGMSDEGLAALIGEDEIDILVDLTMHMSNGRPLLFARKPAPLQVAWLAYPGTTGIPAIDYRLTDPWLDPPGTGDYPYSEMSIRLPDTFWCYDPLTDDLHPNSLPAAICSVTAWIDVFASGSAMRSFSVKSAIVFTFGLVVTSQSGILLSAATARTPMLERVLPQIVSIGPTPPEAKSRLPDRIASFMPEPPVNCVHSVLRSSPAALPRFSIRFSDSIIVSGK